MRRVVFSAWGSRHRLFPGGGWPGIGIGLATVFTLVMWSCGDGEPARDSSTATHPASAQESATHAPPTGTTPGTVTASATASASPASATATATSTASTATPTTPAKTAVAPTTAPAEQGAPARSIAVGEWTYDYYLAGNTCGGEPGKTYLPVTQVLQEVTGADAYISDGEQVRVYGFNGGTSLGTITFRWPTLSYQVPLNEPGGIRTEVTHTYFDARSGSSRVVEVYARGTGTCELTYAG